MRVVFLASREDSIYKSYAFLEFKNLFNPKIDPLLTLGISPSYIGWILALESDVFSYQAEVENILHNYDVIITVQPFLKRKFKKDQLLCYMEREPSDLQKWTTDVESYDLFLDWYNLENTSFVQSCPILYEFKYFNFNKTKIKNKIFIQKRTKISVDFENTFTDYFSWNGMRSYSEYLKSLSECEFGINLCENGSPGQVIADCCLLDVICFARPHKIFSKLLLPEFCHVTSELEFLEKLEYLKKNDYLKETLLKEIRHNCNKITDFKPFKQMIYSKWKEKQMINIIKKFEIEDPMLYAEIFTCNSYNVQPNELLNNTVLDIGANVGMFSVLASISGAKQIYAIEPDFTNYKKLLINTNTFHNIKPINLAITKPGLSEVRMKGEHISVRIIKESEEGGNLVKCLSLEDLLNIIPEDNLILKLDCEGSEYDIVFSSNKLLNRFKYIYVEIHNDLHPNTNYNSNMFEKFMNDLGFKSEKINFTLPISFGMWYPDGSFIPFPPSKNINMKFTRN